MPFIFIILTFFFFTHYAFSGVHLDVFSDSIPIIEDRGDTIKNTSKEDRDTLLFNNSKKDIETVLNYSSKDSMVYFHKKNEIHLFGEAKVRYGKKVNLEAHKIIFNWKKNTLIASGTKTKSGEAIGMPIFTENNIEYITTMVKYNFKTAKGILKNLVTKQGEGIVHGDLVKKNAEESYYISSTRYTTCMLDEPHYAIRAKKLKMSPNKYTVAGPFNLEFNGVPTPLGFFFGIFPMPNKKRASGIVFPNYGESVSRGFYIRDGGLFLAVSQYLSLKFLFNVYSLGGWGTNISTDYRKRYEFNGSMNISYSNVIRQNDDLTTSDTKEYWFRWSHSPISRRSSSFSANMNLGSNDFNANNSFSIDDYISTSFNSNVNYRKTFVGTPFSLNTSLRYFQNVQENKSTLVSSINIVMNRIYPFKKLVKKKNSILSNLSLSYSAQIKGELNNEIQPVSFPFPVANNSVEYKKVDFFDNFGILLKNVKAGVLHTIPISTSFTIFKHFQVSPSFNYREVWYPYELKIDDHDVNTNQLASLDSISKLSRWYSYNTSLGVSTRLYFFYYFKKNVSIRHQLSPSISFGYMPDFSSDNFGFYLNPLIGETAKNSEGSFEYQVLQRRKVSKHYGFLFGVPSQNENGSINFRLGNQLEMKVLDKKDLSGEKEKKITILQNGSIQASYNLIAKEFPLSDITFNGSSRLFDKINFNFSGRIDPYTYIEKINQETKERTLERVPILAWYSGQNIGRLQSFSFAMSTSFKGKQKTKNTTDEIQPTENLSLVEETQLEEIQRNPQRYVNFNVPWNLAFNYVINFVRDSKGKFKEIQSFSFRGDVNLTKTLKIGFTSGYDFTTNKLSMTTLSIHKDLHCWRINATWVPFGPRRSYNFTIAVKSSILRDLKYEQRDSWFDR